jgi:hypothetical protein
LSLSRRQFLEWAGAAAAAAAWPETTIGGAGTTGQTLYNGIVLPPEWPPRRALSFEPDAPPYLAKPPAVIPIDIGRQLFVDDFLIQETTLTRESHAATYHPASPVLVPDRPWERDDKEARAAKRPVNPAAMVFSDGVFYDPHESLFKMWYMAGYTRATGYATSEDGVSWTKPDLDVLPGTNVVDRSQRDSTTVWLDLDAHDDRYRYKMARFEGGRPNLPMTLSCSPDGIHWRRIGQTGLTGDRSTFFRNPFRDVWVFSLRAEDSTGHGRFRRYVESPRFERLRPWPDDGPVIWQMADRLDPQRPEYAVQPQLYNLDCVAYESVLLGLFTMFRGEGSQREKPNDICVGFSRDGFHFSRSHERFVGVSERFGAWNWGNVQSAGGGCLIVGDRLHFYVSGRTGRRGTQEPGRCSTGLATLRRDGFASMRGDAGSPVQTLTTRPVRFSGRHLFVNYHGRTGSLRVEVLDAGGRVIAPFAAAACVPVRGNHVRYLVRWRSGQTLQALAGQVVRFRFLVDEGHLYAFWVSRTAGGASGGYVGAGGPGFSATRDVAAAAP